MSFVARIQSELSRNSLNKHFLAIFIILAALFTAYAGSFKNGFMLDDYNLLVGSETLKSKSWVEIWTKEYKQFYRPFGYTVLRIVNVVCGYDPLNYQLAALGTFAAVCILFYVFLNVLFKECRFAFLATLLYAVHPINSCFVYYKTEVANLTYILCMQASALFFIFYLERKNKYLYGLSVLGYCFALLSHEISFIFPVFIFLILYCLKGKGFKEAVMHCLPYGAVLAGFFILRSVIVKAIKVPGLFDLGISFGQYVDLIRRCLEWYFKQFIWPTQIMLVWDEGIEEGPSIILNGLFIVFVIILVFWAWRNCKRNRVALSCLIILSGLFPISVVSFIYTKVLDTAIIEPHWFGFFSIGMFMLAAMGLEGLAKINKKIGIGLTAVAVGVFVVSTRVDSAVWKDEATYCKYWSKENRLNIMPLVILADHSVPDYGMNAEKYKTCDEISIRGSVFFYQADNDKALLYNNLALNKDYNCAMAHYFFANFFWYRDKIQAEKAADIAHSLKPDRYPTYKELNNFLEDMTIKRKAINRTKVTRTVFGFDEN